MIKPVAALTAYFLLSLLAKKYAELYPKKEKPAKEKQPQQEKKQEKKKQEKKPKEPEPEEEEEEDAPKPPSFVDPYLDLPKR